MGTSYNTNVVTDGLTDCWDAGNRRSWDGHDPFTADPFYDLAGDFTAYMVNVGGAAPALSFDPAHMGSITFDGTDDRIQVGSIATGAGSIIVGWSEISVSVWAWIEPTQGCPKLVSTKHAGSLDMIVCLSDDHSHALNNWFARGVDEVEDSEILDAILDLDKTYKLSESKWLKVNVVGGENTKRPLSFDGKIHITNTKGTGKDIGNSVTDITLTKDDKEKIYLSLKFETTTTFFNVGVRTKLRQSEIDKGEVKDRDGKKLLDLFGIDNKRFCTIFNDKVETDGGKVTTRPNAVAIKELLESGIGHGYHVIHKMRGKVLSKKMDEKAMKAAAKVGTCTVHYGGKSGKGKRIDMEMKSPYYKFKLNIRDTQGKDGYPTRMMCDFTTLKV